MTAQTKLVKTKTNTQTKNKKNRETKYRIADIIDIADILSQNTDILSI